MLGDFRYCSSSSESSDGEEETDSSEMSDVYVEKLQAQKKMIEDKVRECEFKLKDIQSTLKYLNEQRKRMFAERSELVTNDVDDHDIERMLAKERQGMESKELISPSTSSAPLDLNPTIRCVTIQEEEFDSDNE